MKGMVNMKQWLKWLAECGLSFKRTDNGEDGIREYDFGHGIRVVKKESGRGSRGGMVEVNGFTTWHGSVSELIARIMEVLEAAEKAEQEAAEAAAPAPKMDQVEMVAAEANEEAPAVELDILAVRMSIQIVLEAMRMTCDSDEWKELHAQYLRYKEMESQLEGLLQ